ncbi:MAG: hypothetical protein N3F05_03185 [Candidatus Diapherotrites archaeon]|nr:hypothetical protein [Candidatus Diapherotrites archaeon]
MKYTKAFVVIAIFLTFLFLYFYVGYNLSKEKDQTGFVIASLSSNSCVGTPHPCSYWIERSGCTGAGCIWDFDYCTGTPNACYNYGNEFTCKVAGCSWIGSTPTPKPTNCYNWSYECASANANKCACYDAVNCTYNWNYDCYMFSSCNNSKCSKPSDCYDYYGSCYTQNASKCSCQQAVKCKYNSTHKCYTFDSCDNNLCPPEGCVATPTQCMVNNSSKCNCEDAVVCDYHPNHYCYAFAKCDNSLCVKPTPTKTPTPTPACYYDYATCKKGNAAPNCPYDSVVCGWDSSRSCYTFLKCDKNVPTDTNELKCNLSVSADPKVVASGGKVNASVEISCNQKITFSGQIDDPFSGKQYAFSTSLASAIGGTGGTASYSETYSINVPLSAKPGAYIVNVSTTVYSTSSTIPLNLKASASVVVYSAPCGLNIVVEPAQVKRGQKVTANAEVSCASGVKVNKITIDMSAPDGKKDKISSFSSNSGSLSMPYYVKLKEPPGLKYFEAEATVVDTTGASIKIGPAKASFEILSSNSCSISWLEVPKEKFIPGSEIKATAKIECEYGENIRSLSINLCLSKATALEPTKCVNSNPYVLRSVTTGSPAVSNTADVSAVIPINEEDGVLYILTAEASVTENDGDVSNYASSYTTQVVTSPQACYMSLLASPTYVLRGGDTTLTANVSCPTNYPKIEIKISSDGKSSSRSCGFGVCFPWTTICIGTVSGCSHSMNVFIPASTEPNTSKAALAEATITDASDKSLSINANTSYFVSSEIPCSISSFTISPRVAYPGSTITLTATINCQVRTSQTHIKISGPWGTNIEKVCRNTLSGRSETCTATGNVVIPINIGERGEYTFTAIGGGTDRDGKPLPSDFVSSKVGIESPPTYG